MMAPLPNPTPGDRPDLPRVRFGVRTAAGRVVVHDFLGEEFLIGAAPGCDLRLTAPGSPPVAVQFTRRPDGVRVRRVAVTLPVALNDDPLPTGGSVPVRHDDALQVAGLVIGVHIPSQAAQEPAPAYLSPKLIPLDDVPLAVAVPEEPVTPDLTAEHGKLDARRRALDAEEADRRAAWEARDAELVRRRRELDRSAEDLEADRNLWHDRRRAIEQELADLRAAEAAAKEAELARTRDELAGLRRQWVEECRAQREELGRRADQVQSEREALDAERAAHEPRAQALRDGETRLAAQAQELSRQRDMFAADRDIFERERATFEAQKVADAERLTAWEADLSTRERVASDRETLVRTARDEFESERARFQDDLARLERRAAALEAAERAVAVRTQEVNVRLDQLKRDATEWEETVGLAAAEQERLRAEAERLDHQRTELDAQSAALAERAAQLEAQQAVVAVFRAKLDRSRQDMEREAWQLAAARTREDEALAELRRRIQEAEEVRAALSAVQENADQERRRLDERDSLLTAGLEEIRVQKEQLAAEAKRLRDREAELDARSAEFAEQAGMLKGRMSQAVDLQGRLETDRVALREREAALSQSEEARQTLQEQLRRRAEELSARGRALDERELQLAAERAQVEQARAALEGTRQAAEDELTARRQELDGRAAAVGRQAADFAAKEEALARQVGRLKDVGAAVAAERKALATARAAWEADRAAAQAADRDAREQLEAFRARAAADLDALRAQAPELDDQAKLALERLSGARDMLRGHLNELNEFARTSRTDLEAARAQVREEAERLREKNEALDRARDEHRLAVTAFRQQLIEWQGTVADMRRLLSSSENRLDAKQAAAAEAATAANDAAKQLAEETDRLRREREELAVRRTEVERHLSDMREWYRKKLRELAQSRGDGKRGADAPPDDPPNAPRLHEPAADAPPRVPADALVAELEPGDVQLGELLRSLGLVDAETVTALWEAATRQRRTLRQVLLASGTITLYQLALIEAGNLDALVLGRLRVIDRLRVTPKEAIYRVFDPARAGEKSGGLYLLRHLSEAEMQDPVHPDEFRQRFGAAHEAAHPNLAGVVEVLEINGRPAVLLEWLTGLFSADWPAFAAHPGCWMRLALMAASALDAAHKVGLVHGRLTSDSFVLTPEGVLKVTEFGEPAWLAPVQVASAEPSVAADLRAFGQVAFGWSQLAGRKRVARTKGFPEAVWGVIRRLEADAEPPMADTVPMAQPYQSAAELLADFQRIARDTPFSDDAWEKLLKHVLDNAPDVGIGLKKAG
ncbi:hypothetical protein R5W24_003627 [Gemmata sp. JC717]|uniref:hypothetical protein n=1 Tax=Gemmata algarum TaxID=2975278 RepID=UPI0021BB72D0|nr:hypothetical protein [Gemmata algarum]MDY3554503.1 hypothetical protein [Gemmata algarum]